MAYDWPGNVRQLENVIERAFALSPGRAQIVDRRICRDEIRELPAAGRSGRGGRRSRTRASSWNGWSPTSSTALIQRALERTEGNKRQAADLLHLKRTTLIEKLKRLERH